MTSCWQYCSCILKTCSLILFNTFYNCLCFLCLVFTGTQMYRRFSAYAFDACMTELVSPELIYSAVMSEGAGASIPTTSSVNALLDMQMQLSLKASSSSGSKEQTKQSAVTSIKPGGWSQTIRPFNLPYGLDVVMGDVCGGSSSTSMVSFLLLAGWLLITFSYSTTC